MRIFHLGLNATHNLSFLLFFIQDMPYGSHKSDKPLDFLMQSYFFLVPPDFEKENPNTANRKVGWTGSILQLMKKREKD